MSIENKYPVKYAVLELKENGGFINQYKDIIRGYVVSKCYVIESSFRYFSDGSSKTYHKVVFPFKDLNSFRVSFDNKNNYIGNRVVPGYDVDYNLVDIVSELFDTYEEAKIEAYNKNKCMKSRLFLDIPYSVLDSRFKQALEICEKEFDEQLYFCQLFENIVLLNTKDMNISQEFDECRTLKLLKSRDKDS